MFRAFSHDPEFDLTRLSWGWFPAYSSQSHRLAVIDFSKEFEHTALRLMDADGGGATTLFQQKDTLILSPAWAPKGKQIAFSAGSYFRPPGHPTGEVRLIDADGTGIQSISVAGTNSGFPSWSPDGGRIVYEQDGHLVIVKLVDHSHVNLTDSGAQRDNFPQWSPRGDWIVFVSDREQDEQFNCFLIRPDGTGLHKLTASSGDSHCFWSPDAKWLVFSSGRMGYKDERALTETAQPYGQLFAIRPDGTGLRQLSDSKWESATPVWMPE
jgi:TolB protein